MRIPPDDWRALARRPCLPCRGGEAHFEASVALRWAELLPQWRLTEQSQRLERCWTAADFAEAVGLVVQIALRAEEVDHHPDIHIEKYRCLRIELTTHAVGGLTERDFVLAARIEELLTDRTRRP